MHGFALNQIIIIAIHKMGVCKDDLETEESGRVVASLQGKIAGYKEIINILAAEFSLTQSMLDDTGDVPFDIDKAQDEEIDVIGASIEALRKRDEWTKVLGRVEENVVALKDFLLFSAEKSRDLDICQGKYAAQTVYKSFFSQVESEVSYRQRKREEKQKEQAEHLPFEEALENGEPLRKIADRVLAFKG